MSGGVDSSVVAARVARSGLRAFGITLAMWPASREVSRDRGCCSIDAVDDARRVAAALDLPHYVWNLEEDFTNLVIREFEDGYADGRTPNPCVRCNERVKFGVLLERAVAAGATHLATGHYARTGRQRDRWTLHRARDLSRDQSYVLHRLEQRQLAHALFPLGSSSTKAAVREEAAAIGLSTARKPESQDLCFIEGTVRDDLRLRLAGRFRPGDIVDESGARVGTHRGLPFHTVGQRSGLELRPVAPDSAPRYVLELIPAANRIVVGPREALLQDAITVVDCAWVAGEPPEPGARCAAQLRAHGTACDARLEALDGGGGVRLRFDAPVAQAAAGQAAVLYSGDRVLGGGVIARAG